MDTIFVAVKDIDQENLVRPIGAGYGFDCWTQLGGSTGEKTTVARQHFRCNLLLREELFSVFYGGYGDQPALRHHG